MPLQAQANLSALIESTQDHIWSVDLEYRLTTFNRALQQHIESNFGVKIAVGMRLHEALPSERAVLWLPLYERALAQGPFRTEYVLVGGSTLEVYFNPIVVDGKAVGIAVFAKDITERKAAEEARRLLAEVVESCEEAVVTYAPSGEILTWNRGAEDIYGYSAAEAIGKPFSMIIAPERREFADRQTRELLDGAPMIKTQGVAVRKDGGRTRVSVITWPIRNLDGEVTAICTIARDVSELHEAEKTRALLASIRKLLWRRYSCRQSLWDCRQLEPRCRGPVRIHKRGNHRQKHRHARAARLQPRGGFIHGSRGEGRRRYSFRYISSQQGRSRY